MQGFDFWLLRQILYSWFGWGVIIYRALNTKKKKNLHYFKDVSVFLYQHFMSIDCFSVCFKFPSKLNYYSNKAYNFFHYNSFVVTVRWRSVGSFDRKLLPIYVCIAFKGFIVQRTFRAQPNILRTKPLRHVDWRWWNSIHRKKKKKKKKKKKRLSNLAVIVVLLRAVSLALWLIFRGKEACL